MKLPFIDIHIVKGSVLRRQKESIQSLESKFLNQLKRIELEAKMIGKLLHEITTLKGRLKAPLCPKCGKPKIAGGIQWLDHPRGCNNGKQKKTDSI